MGEKQGPSHPSDEDLSPGAPAGTKGTRDQGTGKQGPKGPRERGTREQKSRDQRDQGAKGPGTEKQGPKGSDLWLVVIGCGPGAYLTD